MHYGPVYLHSFYRARGFGPGYCPVAEQVYEQILTLPMFPAMTQGDVERVASALAALALIAPFLGLYPVFLMKLLCFAMFACAFNLLLGFTKMLSFGHAAYFGASAYVTGWLVTAHGWGTIEGIVGKRSATVFPG